MMLWDVRRCYCCFALNLYTYTFRAPGKFQQLSFWIVYIWRIDHTQYIIQILCSLITVTSTWYLIHGSNIITQKIAWKKIRKCLKNSGNNTKIIIICFSNYFQYIILLHFWRLSFPMLFRTTHRFAFYGPNHLHALSN